MRKKIVDTNTYTSLMYTVVFTICIINDNEDDDII